MLDRSKWNCSVSAGGWVGNEYISRTLFVGTQAGCAQAAKDSGYPKHICYMHGFHKFELEFIKTGVIRKGKMAEWFSKSGKRWLCNSPSAF